jgi:hypothetical protein
MLYDRQQRSPPRERTFAELFPWRNIRRALMLVLLIVAIVMIKRSTGPWLARVSEMWGPTTPARAVGYPPARDRRIRLGPGLAPAPASAPPPAGTPPVRPDR